MKLSQSQKSLLWLGMAVLLLVVAVLVFTLDLRRGIGAAGMVDTPVRVALGGEAAQDAVADLPIEQFLPTELLELDAKDAMSRNLALPVSRGANPVAPPFVAQWLGPDLDVATQCLTTAVYYEAAGEPIAGQRGVAQVVLNRLRNPRYPKTICGVIYQGAQRGSGCQFSFACDGSLQRVPNAAGWAIAKAAATSVLNGMSSFEVGQATHYHTMAVFPAWAPQLAKIGIIGHHVFYRPPGTKTFTYDLIDKTPVSAMPLPVETAPVVVLPALPVDARLAPPPSSGASFIPADAGTTRATSTVPTVSASERDSGNQPSSTETPRSNFAVRRSRSPNLPLSTDH